jgi:hypothetical protein
MFAKKYNDSRSCIFSSSYKRVFSLVNAVMAYTSNSPLWRGAALAAGWFLSATSQGSWMLKETARAEWNYLNL